MIEDILDIKEASLDIILDIIPNFENLIEALSKEAARRADLLEKLEEIMDDYWILRDEFRMLDGKVGKEKDGIREIFENFQLEKLEDEEYIDLEFEFEEEDEDVEFFEELKRKAIDIFETIEELIEEFAQTGGLSVA